MHTVATHCACVVVSGSLCSALVCAQTQPAPQSPQSAPSSSLATDTALSSTGSGGHNGRRFNIRSKDGENTLNIGGRAQFRYIANFRDNADTTRDPDADETFTTGFEASRTWLDFGGKTAQGLIDYRLVGAFNKSGGEFEIVYAYGDAKLTDDIAVRWGLDKLPFLREELVPFSLQMAVDRSATNEVFSTKFAEGVWLMGEYERFRWNLAASDGARSENTPFFSPSEADVALTGRAEVRLGEPAWNAYNDFTSWRGNSNGVMLGGAVHWETQGDTAAFVGSTPASVASDGTIVPAQPAGQVSVADQEIFAWTLDASVEGDGWNAVASVVHRITDVPGSDSIEDWGLLAQAGVFVTDQMEIFGRWNAVLPDDDRSRNNDDFHALTGGFNYYFIPESHALKFTADVQVFLDSPAGSSSLVSAPNNTTSLLPGDDEGQVAVRFQILVLF